MRGAEKVLGGGGEVGTVALPLGFLGGGVVFSALPHPPIFLACMTIGLGTLSR